MAEGPVGGAVRRVRKFNVYLGAEIAAEVQAEAERLHHSPNWILRQVYEMARERIRGIPSVPIRGGDALERALQDEGYPFGPLRVGSSEHWRRRGDGDTHARIHRMAEEAMEELGEQPMEGRTDIVCDAVYIGARLLLEEKLPWISP